MNLYQALTWPLRPLTKRTVTDLNDFAGIKWWNLAHTSLALSAAGGIIANWGGWWVTWHVLKIPIFAFVIWVRRFNQTAFAQGLSDDREGIGDGFIAALFFWIAVVQVIDLDHPGLVISSAGFAGVHAFMAWGPESDDSNGEPFIVRAWQNAKTAAKRMSPAPVT